MAATLLGLPARPLALTLAALAALALAAIAAAGGLRTPPLSRIGIRQAIRRPAQSLLLVAGLTLAASLIGASFALQDSFAHSAVTTRSMQVGSVDESVSGPFTTQQLRTSAARLRASPLVAAVAAVYDGPASVRSDVAATDITLLAVPPTFQETYGASHSAGGTSVRFDLLGTHEAVLSATAAALLDLHAGQRFQVEIAGVEIRETVAAVLDHDVTLTTGETVSGLSFPEVVLSLDALNRTLATHGGTPLTANLLCVRNRAGAPGSRSALALLTQLFGRSALLDPSAPHTTHIPTDFDRVLIHPLRPAVINWMGGPPVISSKGELTGSPAARQFFLLLPVFTALLVGAGLLLLVLMILLLAEERRSELGISRAIGLQRADLIRSLLVEGGLYSVAAASLALPLALAIVTLQLRVLTHLPTAGGVLAAAKSAPPRLLRSTTWTSLLAAWSLAVLVVLLVVFACAIWLARLNIVAAIRNLDPPRRHLRFAAIPQILPRALVRRLALTALGCALIAAGLRFGRPELTAALAPNAATAGIEYIKPSPARTLLDLAAPFAGAFISLLANIDLLAATATLALLRLRPARAFGRLSLAFPVLNRRRTAFTTSLIGLVAFLVMLVVINNESAVAQADTRQVAGGFQLGIENVPTGATRLRHAIAGTARTLAGQIDAVAEVTPLYAIQLGATPITLPGREAFDGPGPSVASNHFLSETTMPMLARARGFASDRAVWNAVRNHPGEAVLHYLAGEGLPRSNGFTPFPATIHEAHRPPVTVTIIGLLPINSYWPTLFLSQQTASTLHLRISGFPRSYYFRLAPGASVATTGNRLARTLHLGRHGLTLTDLDGSSQNSYTSTLTAFLSGYLALGLLFGAFTVGVITSRAAVERRQQIGMLRALGFIPRQVAAAFFTEVSFVVTISLAVGTSLAWWIVRTVNQRFSNQLPLPLTQLALILAGSYAVALACTALPTRRAARTSPAEALRYE